MLALSPHFAFQLFKRRNVELINEEAAMFDSLLMDSYVSSTTGVSPSEHGHRCSQNKPGGHAILDLCNLVKLFLAYCGQSASTLKQGFREVIGYITG